MKNKNDLSISGNFILFFEKVIYGKVVSRIMRKNSYSRYENGKSELPCRHLGTLSKLYGVSFDYILGISISENDLISVSQNTYGNIPFKDLLYDITVLDANQISKLSSYMNIIPLGSHQFPASEPPGNFFLESHLRHKI